MWCFSSLWHSSAVQLWADCFVLSRSSLSLYFVLSPVHCCYKILKDHMHLGSVDFPIQRVLTSLGVCIQQGHESYGSTSLESALVKTTMCTGSASSEKGHPC